MIKTILVCTLTMSAGFALAQNNISPAISEQIIKFNRSVKIHQAIKALADLDRNINDADVEKMYTEPLLCSPGDVNVDREQDLQAIRKLISIMRTNKEIAECFLLLQTFEYVAKEEGAIAFFQKRASCDRVLKNLEESLESIAKNPAIDSPKQANQD